MNVIYRSKSDIRAETEIALKQFLRTGGSVEVVATKKAPKQKMRGKSSRGFVTGTSGFANGMPRKSAFAI
jgi:hypothetical protein